MTHIVRYFSQRVVVLRSKTSSVFVNVFSVTTFGVCFDGVVHHDLVFTVLLGGLIRLFLVVLRLVCFVGDCAFSLSNASDRYSYLLEKT